MAVEGNTEALGVEFGVPNREDWEGVAETD